MTENFVMASSVFVNTNMSINKINYFTTTSQKVLMGTSLWLVH